MKKLALTIVILSLVFASVSFGAQTPFLKYPTVVTSAGQSSEAEILTYVCDEMGIKYDYCDILSEKEFAAGVGLGGAKSGPGKHVTVTSSQAKGTKYESLWLVLGASLKGMGASGLSVDDEVSRLKKLINYAKDKKITLIALAIGGEIRRGLPGSLNEQIIDAVAPFCDVIITTKDTNKDGKFTQLAKSKNLKFVEIDSQESLLELVPEIFITAK